MTQTTHEKPEFVDGVQVTVCTLPDYEPSHMNTVAALAVITAALPAGLVGTKIESGAFDGDFLVSLRNDWRDHADTDWYIQTRGGLPHRFERLWGPGTSFSVIISASAR